MNTYNNNLFKQIYIKNIYKLKKLNIFRNNFI